MTKNTKTAINTVVFLCIGAFLFYWAIGKEDTSLLFSEIKKANMGWIALSLFCGILSHLARSLRWNLLLAPMGYKAGVWSSFHAVILGYLVNMALPRVGEITRPAALAKVENIPFNKLVGTVVIERVVDMIITLLIAVSIFFIQFNAIADFVTDLLGGISANLVWLYGVLGFFALIAVFLAYKYRNLIYKLPIINKFKEFIEGILEGVSTILKLEQKGLFIFYSLFIWLMYFCMPFFVLFALPGTAHLGVSAGLTVLLFGTAAMIVPVPGGVGTFELMVPKALALYDIDSLLANSYTLITHALQFIVILGVGVFSVLYFVIKTQKNKSNELAGSTER